MSGVLNAMLLGGPCVWPTTQQSINTISIFSRQNLVHTVTGYRNWYSMLEFITDVQLTKQ